MIDAVHNSREPPQAPKADAHGEAAILLVESLIHGLIAKRVLSVSEAVEIVDVATEVKLEAGIEDGAPTVASQTSINLLQDISASLKFDLEERAASGTPND